MFTASCFQEFQIYQRWPCVSFSCRLAHKLDQALTRGSSYIGTFSMFKFHYEEMLARYGSAPLKVVYEDTDSLLYSIQTNDLYADMAIFKHFLCLSDYPEDHILHDKTNENVPNMLTDELDRKILKEVVFLRSNFAHYSIDHLRGTKQSAKQIQKSVKNTLNLTLFGSRLFSKSSVQRDMTQLNSVGHQIIVSSVKKIALSCFDDKRYILHDTVFFLAYG